MIHVAHVKLPSRNPRKVTESDNLHEVTPLLSQAVLSKEDDVVAFKEVEGHLRFLGRPDDNRNPTHFLILTIGLESTSDRPSTFLGAK